MENENTNILTKNERNELRRAEKQNAHKKYIMIQKIKAWIPWLILLGIMIGGLYWAVNAAQTASKNRPGEAVTIMGSDHVAPGGAADVTYNSNPPTSGPHAGPTSWGFSSEEILAENAIHNLEHGGIWITYKNIDEASITTLEGIAKQNSASVMISPRAANDANIAVASWGRILKLETVDEIAIRDFIRQNKNKSPEPIAR